MSLPVHVGGGGGAGVAGSAVPPPAPEVVDEVILATAGYDHTIKFWQAHTGKCVRTLQHADSQVLWPSMILHNTLEQRQD